MNYLLYLDFQMVFNILFFSLLYVVRGGLTLREGIHLMEEIHRTNRLNAIDLVEVNPKIGNDTSVHLTTDAAIHILQAALGYTRRGLKVPAGITDIPLQTFR